MSYKKQTKKVGPLQTGKAEGGAGTWLNFTKWKREHMNWVKPAWDKGCEGDEGLLQHANSC